eukprot:NODE_1120_length_2112_cov_0.467958.p2 type:complete len:228 gc:universal NODE_1120_length_2112_cov_0.467958:1038-1721(+)
MSLCRQNNLCFHCKQRGHRVVDCPELPRKNNGNQLLQKNENSTVSLLFGDMRCVKSVLKVEGDDTKRSKEIVINGRVEERESQLFVDPGSQINVVTNAWLVANTPGLIVLLSPYSNIRGVNGSTEPVLGRVNLHVRVNDLSNAILPFEIIRECTSPILLGYEALVPLQIVINGKTRVVEVGDQSIPMDVPAVCMVGVEHGKRVVDASLEMKAPANQINKLKYNYFDQ